MKLLHVVGARPNFMKVAPVLAAVRDRGVGEQILIHTGQHYDANMSDVFFEHLGIPRPDFNLGVGSGTHAQQTASIMKSIEPLIVSQKPDLVLVYGDVNSTIAAALVCAKLLVPVAHVEAGLRSWDRTMPEEVNRVLTDQIADLLFTPSADGNDNLAHEGVARDKIHLVGNVMIDTLVRRLPYCRCPESIELPSRFALATLHRPSNVDDPAALASLIHGLSRIAQIVPVIFPVHPRTRERIGRLGLPQETTVGVTLVDPLGYLDFLFLEKHAALVVTDSGGIQEETTFLGVPCLTLRSNTERPITITAGTNLLVGQDMQLLVREARRILGEATDRRNPPPLWDGHAAERIAAVLDHWRGASGFERAPAGPNANGSEGSGR
jgi:UDP-N-acetylglucosamine 2-epimerase (non-hydrolysing)